MVSLNLGGFRHGIDKPVKGSLLDMFSKSPTGTDGDRDGMIYDGTPQERPASKANDRKMPPAIHAMLKVHIDLGVTNDKVERPQDVYKGDEEELIGKTFGEMPQEAQVPIMRGIVNELRHHFRNSIGRGDSYTNAIQNQIINQWHKEGSILPNRIFLDKDNSMWHAYGSTEEFSEWARGFTRDIEVRMYTAGDGDWSDWDKMLKDAIEGRNKGTDTIAAAKKVLSGYKD